jgi:4-amino-4-deoxy-L-arabinose transferase-like glycosyltransferase
MNPNLPEAQSPHFVFSKMLWGQQAKLLWLLVTASVLLLCMLGVRELWTQEWRWADVVWEMLQRQDYLHPYFAGQPYYDKPLLSYWLMIITSSLSGGLTEWSLRLPSALAGITTIACTYWLGKHLANRETGLLAGWMLLSSYFFVFWARTATADMLNVAGIMLALVWYFARKEKPGFVSYSVFFFILGLTSLAKGLIAAIIPILMIAPDLYQQHAWKKHLRLSCYLASLVAGIFYLIPFWLSTHFAGYSYQENGLYQVFHENFVRYFKPFDHQDPIYCYFMYLPVYLMPWTVLFIFAGIAAIKHWKTLAYGQRWLTLATGLVFLFLTLSGSRRSYYILPIVPFATLMTANWTITWLQSSTSSGSRDTLRYVWLNRILFSLITALFIWFCVLQPLYYSHGGIRAFAKQVYAQATVTGPWQDWQIVLLDAKDKVLFYLDSTKPATQLIPINATDETMITALKKWLASNEQSHTIFITSKRHADILQPYLKNSLLVPMPPHLFTKKIGPNDPVAFIMVARKLSIHKS